MRRAAAPSCSQPEIAVCVVGQLRAAARPKLARNLRAAWDRVGPGCVDLYLHIGLEAQVATANHRALRGSSYENASVAAVALRPVEWRATTYPLVRPNANCTMDDGGGAASATVCQKRPFNERANQTETGCGDASCTHCSASAYFPQAIRIAACAGMVMEAQKRLARPYRYFAFHRPDMWLYGIPPYAGWAFADAGLTRTALFCDGGASYVYDIFALMSYTQVPIVAGLGGLYARCQSKHENLALGCLASEIRRLRRRQRAQREAGAQWRRRPRVRLHRYVRIRPSQLHKLSWLWIAIGAIHQMGGACGRPAAVVSARREEKCHERRASQ